MKTTTAMQELTQQDIFTHKPPVKIHAVLIQNTGHNIDDTALASKDRVARVVVFGKQMMHETHRLHLMKQRKHPNHEIITDATTSEMLLHPTGDTSAFTKQELENIIRLLSHEFESGGYAHNFRFTLGTLPVAIAQCKRKGCKDDQDLILNYLLQFEKGANGDKLIAIIKQGVNAKNTDNADVEIRSVTSKTVLAQLPLDKMSTLWMSERGTPIVDITESHLDHELGEGLKAFDVLMRNCAHEIPQTFVEIARNPQVIHHVLADHIDIVSNHLITHSVLQNDQQTSGIKVYRSAPNLPHGWKTSIKGMIDGVLGHTTKVEERDVPALQHELHTAIGTVTIRDYKPVATQPWTQSARKIINDIAATFELTEMTQIQRKDREATVKLAKSQRFPLTLCDGGSPRGRIATSLPWPQSANLFRAQR